MKLPRPFAIMGNGPLFSLPLTIAAVAIVSGATVPISSVFAQTAEVRITELRCNADPEVVAITNQGSVGQDLTGWTLHSDPLEGEVFNMSAIGTLAPGATVFVQSGPSAGGFFVWSPIMIFRDGPPSDFARILDSNGGLVHEVSCTGGSPTQTAAPSATQSPSPTPLAGAIIDGGGDPGTSNGTMGLEPALAIALGALLLTMGGASLVGMRPRRASAVGSMEIGRATWTGNSRATSIRETLYVLASLGLLVVVIKLIATRRR